MIENKILNILIYQQKYEVLYKIHPEWFNDKINSEIYKCCIHCFQKEKALNVNNVKNYINDNDYNDKQKDMMLNKVNSVNAEIVIYSNSLIKDFEDYYKNNKFTDLMNTFLNKANNADIKEKALAETYRKIISNKQDYELYELNECINEYIDKMLKGENNIFHERSIHLKFNILSKVFDRYIRPWLIVIASRPGMHKTTFLLNIINELLYLDKKGIYFSFEDSIETLRNKIISIKRNLSFERVSDCNFTEREKKEIQAMKDQLLINKLWITDRRCTLLKFREIVDRQFAIRNYDFIAIDYLQLFCRERGMKEHEYLDLLTQEMISITHDFHVPILLLSQVNDRDDSGDNINVHLGNLKGSSGIEQNARQVIILNGNRKELNRKVRMVKNTGGGLFDVDIVFNENGLIGGMNG